jgi:two-component system sensor histidine kinase KdpD
MIAMINGVLTYRIRLVEKASRIREERANSVKLYNTILNSLSHELRTPIAAIMAAADNLQLNKKLTVEHKEQLITEISKASIRLNQQVENLLNISRLESGHIQPKADWCDVVELVYTVVKRVEENSPSRKIDININQHMPLCYLDKGMLDQVLYNLLNNAAIHTEEKARILITTSFHTDLLQVLIEDSGSGFSGKKMKDVFDKFSREKHPATSGSGLGLSIVKGFTEALGGAVNLEKSAIGGARFTVVIPVRQTTSLS